MDKNTQTARLIKENRLKTNISQKFIASKLGITETAYGRIENGYTQITINNLFVIGECLNISVASLLSLESTTTINNEGFVMNNINQGQLHINLTPDEFQKIYQRLKEDKMK